MLLAISPAKHRSAPKKRDLKSMMKLRRWRRNEMKISGLQRFQCTTLQPSCVLGNDQMNMIIYTSGKSQSPHGEVGLIFINNVQSFDTWRELRRSWYAAELCLNPQNFIFNFGDDLEFPMSEFCWIVSIMMHKTVRVFQFNGLVQT